MPRGFQFPPNHRTDLWFPSGIDSGSPVAQRGYNWLSVIARLKPGVSRQQAQAEMDAIAGQLAREYPKQNSTRTAVRVILELDRIVGSSRKALLIILGVVGLVLLIACANVANLSLARNVAREKEIAMRAALGAARSRLIRQLCSENVLLALTGGGGGVLLALWGTRLLSGMAPGVIPRAAEIGVDRSVLIFAVALSAATSLIFGLGPAIQNTRADLIAQLNESSRTTTDSAGRKRFRNLLIAAETAIAALLLVGAGLLIGSYYRLSRVDPGFNPRNVITMSLDLTYDTAQRAQFYRSLLVRVRSFPGVTSSAESWPLPFGDSDPSTALEIEGRSFPAGASPSSRAHIVTPGYFQAMGIRMQKGRDFTDGDTEDNLQTVIVDEAFVRAFFPNENPLGKRIQPSLTMKDPPPWREIVGVVSSTKEMGLAEDFQPQFYMPYAQLAGIDPGLIVKTESDLEGIVPVVRGVVAEMDKDVPVYGVRTIDEVISSSNAVGRCNTVLVGLFGGLALILAVVGIYGVVSYSVNRSTHDIGIRIALGASPRHVLHCTMREGLKPVLAGLLVGLVAALACARLLVSMLYEMNPADPATIAIVAVLLVSAAALACYLPARRAMRIDPMSALRFE